jgi:hypothetical protein
LVGFIANSSATTDDGGAASIKRRYIKLSQAGILSRLTKTLSGLAPRYSRRRSAPALAGDRCKVTDADGKFWAYIGAPEGWPIGGFHRELISYN